MIETEIFKKTKINLNKLESFGFKKQNNIYTYTQMINDNFKVEITIENEEKISGKIYDTETNEEYTNYRIENYTSGFANTIKEEYIKILEDIKNKCGTENYFVSVQANNLTQILKEKYNDTPEFAWPKFPTDGIFKNPQNNKWYALIMNINKNKLEKDNNEKIDIINVKLDPNKIKALLSKKGYYKAYHMNKENWISIILDETIPDEEILKLIEESHNFTIKSKEWLVPANPKFYDIKNCFKKENRILWKQSNNINVGDIVYIYAASPYSCILYKCIAIETGIPYEYKDKKLNMKKVMKLELQKQYKEEDFTFKTLNEYGINAIRGPRSIPEKLSKKLKESK